MIGVGISLSTLAVWSKNSAPELATTPTTVNAPWMGNGDGTYTIDGSQTSGVSLFYGGLLEVGKRYKAVVEISSLETAGSLRLISHPNSVNLGTISTQGHVVAEIVAGAINFNIIANPDGFSGTVKLQSLREISA